MSDPCETNQCGQDDCDFVFSNVTVLPTIGFGSRIEWTLHDEFRVPGPHTFQLQAARAGVSTVDDWVNVGLPAVDAFYLLDDVQRVHGKTQWTHYRVQLTTPNGSILRSRATLAQGAMSWFDRQLYRTTLLTWTKQFRLSQASEGYLLKRRLAGERCACVNHLTDDPSDAQCPECYGTGIVSGYYPAESCIYAQFQLPGRGVHDHLDPAQTRSNIDPAKDSLAIMLAVPQLFSKDIWVEKQTDQRYTVERWTPRIVVRERPVVLDVVLTQLEFSHPAYRIEITR